ncbi:MAG: carbohydrate kinase family protein [Actinomycetes bacterium]
MVPLSTARWRRWRSPLTTPAELDLLVIGDLNPDLIVTGSDLTPRFGQVEQLVSGATLETGGSAAITALGAARLGLRVGLVAAVGDDDLGRLMVDRVTAAGVDVSHVRVHDSAPTGLSVILDRGDDRAIFTSLGSIDALTPDDLSTLADHPARHVHLASFFLLDPGLRASFPLTLRRFRSTGVTTSVDTNWDPHGLWQLDELMREVDIALPNRAELTAVTRQPGLRDGLRTLSDLGPRTACKLGRVGAATLVDDRVVAVAAPTSEELVDAVGAGDSFNAGYLCGHLTGQGLVDSLRLAVAVGTASTGGRGGTATQPDLPTAQRMAQRLAVVDDFEELP